MEPQARLRRRRSGADGCQRVREASQSSSDVGRVPRSAKSHVGARKHEIDVRRDERLAVAAGLLLLDEANNRGVAFCEGLLRIRRSGGSRDDNGSDHYDGTENRTPNRAHLLRLRGVTAGQPPKASPRTGLARVEGVRVAAARWETGRTEAFSDGVFAIAITLLVLDIRVPITDFDNLWRGIVHQWPAYLGYATSFLTIGGIWLAHHGIFRRLRYADNRVMRINLLLLMAVSFLPYPTRLIAEAIRDQSAERAAAIFYGITLFAISLLFGALWGAVARDRELLKPEVTDEEVNAILVAATPSIGLYAGMTALAIALPRVAALGYLVIAVLGVLRARGDIERATPASGLRPS